MEQRCLKRAETSGRSDDNAVVIKQRVQTFFDETMPIIDHYKKFSKVNHIDATTSIADVFEMTKAALLEPGKHVKSEVSPIPSNIAVEIVDDGIHPDIEALRTDL